MLPSPDLYHWVPGAKMMDGHTGFTVYIYYILYSMYGYSVHLPHLTVGKKEQFSHVWSSKIWILPKAATPKYDIPAVVPISK